MLVLHTAFRTVPAAVLAMACLLLPRASLAEGEALRRMERAIVTIAEKVGRSVVSVKVANRRSRPPLPPAKGAPNSAVERFKEALDKQFRLRNAWGSGFAVDEDHVVTTARVAPSWIKTLRVLLPTGETRKGKVVGRSEKDNTVLIKVEKGGLTPLRFARIPARPGDLVMSVGNSFEVIDRMWRNAYSLGVVSGIHEAKKGFNTYYEGTVIETDAAVNPGNYGGPLVNRRGEVVGMVASTFTFRRWLGCAVPADRVTRALDRIRRGETEPDPGASFEIPGLGATLKVVEGAWEVVAVLDGGPARELGWRPRDRIILVEGRPTRGGKNEALEAFSPGRTVKVRLWRDRWERDFEVDLSEGGDEDEF